MFNSFNEVRRFYQDHAAQIKLVESTLSNKLGIADVRVLAKQTGIVAVGHNSNDDKVMEVPLALRSDGKLRVHRA